MKGWMIGWFFLVLCAAPAGAENSAMSLYQVCSDHTPNSVNDTFCSAYSLGYIAGVTAGEAQLDGGMKVICIPVDAVNGFQARLVIEKYLKDHPEALNLNMHVVVFRAISKAFPCRPPKKAPPR